MLSTSSFCRYVDKISKQIAGTVSDILGKKDEKKSQDEKLPQYAFAVRLLWPCLAGVLDEVQENRGLEAPQRAELSWAFLGKHVRTPGSACRASNCDTSSFRTFAESRN